MNRKQKRFLRKVKVMVVCGAMAYLAIGAIEVSLMNQNEFVNIRPSMIVEAVPVETEPMEIRTMKVRSGSITREATFEESECKALVRIAMAESESEGVIGKALVMRVVLNRVESKEFPDSIEGVIFEKGQFSPVSNGRWERVKPDKECWKALDMIKNGWDESEGALYFESRSDSTWHRDNLEYLLKYGGHYFYKDKE